MGKQLPFGRQAGSVEKQQKTLHCHYATSRKKERNQVDKDLKDKWIMYDRWDPYASKRNF